ARVGFRSLAGQHHDKTLRLADHRLGNVEELERSARVADGLGQRREAGVLRVKGDVEIRTDVGPAILHAPAVTRTAEARRTAEIPTIATPMAVARTPAEVTAMPAGTPRIVTPRPAKITLG